MWKSDKNKEGSDVDVALASIASQKRRFRGSFVRRSKLMSVIAVAIGLTYMTAAQKEEEDIGGVENPKFEDQQFINFADRGGERVKNLKILWTSYMKAENSGFIPDGRPHSSK